MLRPSLIALLVLSAGSLGSSRTGHAAGAHEHGIGDLAVAVEGRRLDLILTVPMADLAGTERVPESDSGRRALAERVEDLRDGDPVAGAGCTLQSFDLTMPDGFAAAIAAIETASDGHAPAESHDHDHEHHEREHGDGEARDSHDHSHRHAHDDHGHGEDVEHGEASSPHADAIASWVLRCDEPVRRMEVMLFDALPSLVELRVQMITDSGQGAARLRADRRTLTLP